MNSEQIIGNWETIKEDVRKEWHKLTPEHLEQINGDRIKLAGMIRENYGVTDLEAESQVTTFFSRKGACEVSG